MGERRHSHRKTDAIFLALSHSTRRRMLEFLQSRSYCVTEIAASFDLSLNVAFKHLKSLERAKLLERTRTGSFHTLRSDPRALQSATAWLSRHLAFWEGGLNSLASFTLPSQRPPKPP